MYSIVFTRSAEKELDRLPNKSYIKVMAAIEKLADKPYPTGVKKIQGHKNLWRLREGDYRVVYSIIDEVLTVEIIKIGHRKDVYKNI
jgi:mRNA interferase RelE/StbE